MTDEIMIIKATIASGHATSVIAFDKEPDGMTYDTYYEVLKQRYIEIIREYHIAWDKSREVKNQDNTFKYVNEITRVLCDDFEKEYPFIQLNGFVRRFASMNVKDVRYPKILITAERVKKYNG